MEMDRRIGVISSPLLILYWLFSTFSLWISLMLHAETDSWQYLSLWTLAILATIIFGQSCWAEKLPKGRHDGSAECNISWASSLTMSWVTPRILNLSKIRKTREGGAFLLSDLEEMPKQYRIETDFDQFERKFHHQLKNDQKRTKNTEKDGLLKADEQLAKYTLYKTILKTYPKEIAIAAAYNCLWGMLRWFTPFFLTKILHVIKYSTPGEDYISNSVGIMSCFGYCTSGRVL